MLRTTRGAGYLGKNYAVGLEISCPGGAYAWAPKIPSAANLAGAVPRKCEMVHNRANFRVLAPFVIGRDLSDAGSESI
jgi:hypothetical protein